MISAELRTAFSETSEERISTPLTVFREYCKTVGHTHPERLEPYIKALIGVFSETGVVNKPVVVDLCPGFSPKVIFALAELNYYGQCVTIDVDPKALGHQLKVAEQLGVKFTTAGLERDVFIPTNFTDPVVLVGNHIVDDLLADQFSREKNIDYWQSVFEDPREQIKFWNNLSQDTEFLNTMICQMLGQLSRLQPGSIVILNNYLSNFDTINQITNRTNVCDVFMRGLQLEMGNVGFQNLNVNVKPGTWVVARKS